MWTKRCLAAAFLVILPASAQEFGAHYSSDIQSFPKQTINDLKLLGQGRLSQEQVVYGFDEPLDTDVFDAARDYFNPTSQSISEQGEQTLQGLAAEDPVANAILAAGWASDLEIGNSLDIDSAMRNAVINGDWISQQAVNAQLLQSSLLEPQRLTLLEDQVTGGERPEAGAALATSYQFGFSGEIELEKANIFWQLAVEQAPNDLNFYGYANFLKDQGLYQEAAATFARASDFAPAIAGEFGIAWESGDIEAIKRLLPRLEIFATEDRETALLAGDYFRSLALATELEGQSAALETALSHYERAIEIEEGRDIFAARAKSRIAEVYVAFPDVAPETWEKDVRQLFNDAAKAGDAGGFLGLAKIALQWKDYAQAYRLASQASELGNQDQIREAREILVEVCRPGVWDTDCAPVPVFFVTTRKVDPADSQQFGKSDSSMREPTFGVAFTPVPLFSQAYGARQTLYEAARRVVADTLGEESLALLDDEETLTVFTFPDGKMWGDAAARVAADAGLDDAFAFVHGFNVAFDAAVRTSAETMEKADFPSLPVALSWPSEGELLSYGQDFGRANMACPRLFEGLKQLGRGFGGERITLMAHSMGSLVVYSMVNGCDQDPASEWNYAPVANLIYAAPDMPRFNFEEKLEFQTTQRAAHTTLYVTSNDTALALSASNAFNEEVRAGQIPPEGPIVGDHLMTIDATEAEGNIVDFVTGNINHGYVFTQPQVVADLSQLLNLQYVPENRSCLKRANRVPDYWRIRGDCPAEQ